MFKKLRCDAFATLLIAGVLWTGCLTADAQNVQCSNRAAGDNTNACANTRFVQSALASYTVTLTVGSTVIAGGTSNGVLFNNAGVLGNTAQGPANSVLTANAGAPSFSASPTIGTSVTTPRVIGGTGTASTLTVDSTSGAGVTDMILFRTGSQTQLASFETAPRTGGVSILGTITPGSLYTNGTYNGVALTGGTGTGATANIVVSGGVVASAAIVNGGSGYTFGDSLSAAAANIGGTGSGFAVQAGVGNTYIPTGGGTAQGFYHSSIGTNADNPRIIPNTKFDIFGIGPIPPAGTMFLMGDFADSSPGNISMIFAQCHQSGTRYCAGVTGTGRNMSAGGSVWGIQGMGLCGANGSFCAGGQFDAQAGATAVGNAIAVIMGTGSASADCFNNNNCPSTAYFTTVSNPTASGASGSAPYTGWFINDSSTNPLQPSGGGTTTALIHTSGAGNLNADYGVYFQTATFGQCAFAYRPAGTRTFCVDGSGNTTTPIAFGGTAVGSTLQLKGTSNAAPVGDQVNVLSGTRTIWRFRQNPAGDVGGAFPDCWPGNDATSQNAECGIVSANTNAGFSLRMKGTGIFALHGPADASQSATMCLYEDETTGTDRMCWSAASSIATSYTLVWPAALPATTLPLVSTSGGVMSFSATFNNANLTAGTASTSTGTGTLVVTGGVGVSGQLNVARGLATTSAVLSSIAGAVGFDNASEMRFYTDGFPYTFYTNNAFSVIGAKIYTSTGFSVGNVNSDPGAGAILANTSITATTFASIGTKVRAGGAAPAVSACGTSPAISGSDLAGLVTTGTATPVSCTITFNAAYATEPYCVVHGKTAAQVTSYTVSASAIVVTTTATSNVALNYVCVARSGG